MKRFAKGVGLVALLVVAVLLIIPLISLKYYKPELQAEVAKHINGQLEFGDVHLTLLSGPGIRFDDVSIANTSVDYNGQKVLEARQLTLRFELIPLLKKQLRAHVDFVEPRLEVVKGSNKNSLTTLIKDGKPAEQAVGLPAKPAERKADETPAASEKPNMLEDAVVSQLKMSGARLTFTDIRTNPEKRIASVTRLNVIAMNIGFNRDIRVQLSSTVEDPHLRGLVELRLKLHPEMIKNKFEKMALEGELDATQATASYGGWFVKKPGGTLKFAFSGLATPQQLELNEFKFIVLDAGLEGMLSLSDYEAMRARLNLSLPETDLAKLKDAFPKHAEILKNGKITFQGDLEGTAYGQEPMRMRAELRAGFNQSDVTLLALSQDAREQKFDVTLRSSVLDVGELLEPMRIVGESTAAPTSSTVTSANPTSPSISQPQSPSRVSTEPLKEQPETPAVSTSNAKVVTPTTASPALPTAASPLLVDINAQIDTVHFKQFSAKDTLLLAAVTDQNIKVERFSVKGFGGSIQSQGIVQFKQEGKPFSLKLALSRINPQAVLQAMGRSSQLPINGLVDVQGQFTGQSASLPVFLDHLVGSGSYVVSEGSAVNSKGVALAIQKDLEKKVGQLPVAKGLGQIDELLQNKRVQELAKKNNLAIDKLRHDVGSLRDMKFVDEQSVKSQLTGIRGQFEVKNRMVSFDTNNVHSSGKLFLQSQVWFDSRLQGKGRYEFSDEFKKKMLSQSSQARHLFDTDGSFIVEFALGGTVNDPTVDIEFQKIVARYEKNSGRDIEEDTKKIIDDLMKGDSRKKIDSLKDKIKKELERNKIRIPGL